jgi:hypothetical protein
MLLNHKLDKNNANDMGDDNDDEVKEACITTAAETTSAADFGRGSHFSHTSSPSPFEVQYNMLQQRAREARETAVEQQTGPMPMAADNAGIGGVDFMNGQRERPSVEWKIPTNVRDAYGIAMPMAGHSLARAAAGAGTEKIVLGIAPAEKIVFRKPFPAPVNTAQPIHPLDTRCIA